MSEIKPVAWRWKEDGSNFMYGNSLPLTFNRSRHSWQQLYTAASLEAAREEGRRAGLEEAAQVCGDQVDPHPERHFDEGYNQAVRDCADAIRALKEKPCSP